MIPRDFVETLLGRVDIVDVVDRHVPLRKAGANHVACCPFHREKTPSFTVSQSKQFYHCFGCGAHGTAIGFLMEYAGKPFVDAVEELAREVGLTVPRSDAEPESRAPAARWAAVMAAATRYYKAELRKSQRAIAYLRGRGLTGEVAARFGIGYAPAGWQSLEAAFDDYADPALEQCGLVIVGEGARRYDRFRDRIMFPILDSRGQTIAFGGRVIDAGEPKYLNSPETPLFSKGRELYGLFQARQAIRDSGRVIVVEGYMDVVALAQHGIANAVATLGTATTPAHAAKLFRNADSVQFCFDGDAAGRRAAWRALEATLGAISDGKEARFLFLPEGQDPDDHVRASGAEAFASLLADALPLSDFLLRELCAHHPPTTAEGRAALVASARPYLGMLQAPVLAAILRRRVAEIAGVSENEVLSRSARGRSAPGNTSRDRAAAPERADAADAGGGAFAAPANAQDWRGDDAIRGATGSSRGRGRAPLRRAARAASEARILLKNVLAFPALGALVRNDPDLAADESAEARALAAVLGAVHEDGARAASATAGSVLELLRDSPLAPLLWEAAGQANVEQLDEAGARAEIEAALARRTERREAERVAELIARGSLAALSPEEKQLIARYRKAGGPDDSSLGLGEAGHARRDSKL